MGRSKGSQRTKGNTRPSSSGHSAELLNYSGKPISGFLGFKLPTKDTSSENHAVQQTSNGEVDSSVNPVFRLLMKKMLKRDAITKLKAVSEFNDFCAKEEKEILYSVLPFWPRLFNRLALDCDRRVREATHKANKTLLIKVKRNFAPYLKSIMGTWLIGQCDSYAPSACAAQHAFSSAFPQQKQAEALLFCKNDVFTFFQEILYYQSSNSADQKTCSKKSEADGPFDLIVTGILRSMKLFISLLSQKDQIKIVEGDIAAIISNKMFWEFAQSKDPQVRAAWYDVVSTLCHVVPEAFKNTTHKLILAALSCLSEEDPAVAPAVWECSLSCMDSFENYWMFIDVRKVVLPQLWAFLKDGGKGNATAVYPCLLPFISKLPKGVTEDKSSFYRELFCSMRKSLYLERIKSSSSECNAVIRAFGECLHYAVSCSSLLSKEIDFLLRISVDELVPLIESSFTVTGYHLPVSSLYPLLGQFLCFLEAKAQLGSIENKQSLYIESLTVLWNNILPVFLKVVNQEHSENKNFDLSCLAYFFHCLHKPNNTPIKKKKFVRFHSECSDNNNHDMHCLLSTCIENSNHLEHILTEESFLFQNTIKFWKILCERYEKNGEPSYIKLMSEIISAACSIDIFSKLLNVFGVQCRKTESPVVFFRFFILNWLKKSSPCTSALDSIVDITFSLCSCTDEDSALAILYDTCEVEYEKLFLRLAVRGLSQYKKDALVSQWSRSSAFGFALFNHIKNVTILLSPTEKDDNFMFTEAYCQSIHSCFSKAKEGEISVDDECIKRTLDLFCHCFPDPTLWDNFDKNEYSIIDFVCETCECIFGTPNLYWDCPAFHSLMLKLFQFTLKINEKDMEGKLFRMVSSVWKKSLSCIEKNVKEVPENRNFIHLASEELHFLFVNLKFCKSIKNLLEHTMMFLSLLKNTFSTEDLEHADTSNHIVLSTLENVLPTEEEWETMKNGLSLTTLPFVLQGVIFSPLHCEPHALDCSVEIPEYVLTSEFISRLLIEREFRINFMNYPIKCIENSLLLHLPHIFWSLSYAIGRGYGSTESSKEYLCLRKLDENILELTKLLTKENAFKLIHILFVLSLNEGVTWSIPLQKAVEIVKYLYPDGIQIFVDLISEANKSNSCHKYITAQVFLGSITIKEKLLIVEELTCSILNSSEIFGNESDTFRMLSEVCCCIQDLDLARQPGIIEQIKTILEVMIDSQSLFEANEDNYLCFVIQISAILHALIRNSCILFSNELWCAVIHLLVSWLKKCKENENIISCTPSYITLMHQTSSLVSLVSSKLNYGNGDEFDIEVCSSAAVTEWKQVFQNQISNDFLTLFLKVAGNVVELRKLPKSIEILLTEMNETTKHLTVQQILTTFMPSYDERKRNNDSAQWLDNIHNMFVAFAPFLTSGIRALQFAIHSIIIRIMPHIPNLIISKTEMNDSSYMEEKVSEKRFPLIEMLQYTSNIVDTMLLGIKADDCCIVQPYTDSYTYTMAYLLAWNVVIEFFTALSSEDRSSYACYLEESNLLSALLCNLIRLMPGNLSNARKKENSSCSAFLEFPTLRASDSPSSEELQDIACNVYFNALKKAPALVRTWWNNLDKRTGEIVERFTSNNVSGYLSQQEIQAVQDSDTQFENMTVKARLVSKEVLATYTLDDLTVELSIQLPSNYPLGPIVVDSRGKIGVGQAQWRNWLLQLTTFLNYQNGSIVDALSLWKKNLDKKFEGVEECMICYYVIHSSSYKLPNFSCSTCKKKFHSSCLFKWFNTSNNSTCPLCRNYF